jgi:hypothetical protein
MSMSIPTFPTLPTPAPKLLAALMFSLLALAATASAQNIAWSAANTTKAPKITLDKSNAVYIWHNGTAVTLTTTANTKAGHTFKGIITVTGSKGKLSGLAGKKLEKGDVFQLTSPTVINFTYHTYTASDTLKFKLTGGTALSISASVDGLYWTSLIHYGKNETVSSPNPTVFDLTK